MNNANQTTGLVIWCQLKKLALLLAGAYLVYRLRMIIAAVVISVILSYVLLPAVEWLCSFSVKGIGRKPHRLIATIVVFLAFLGVVAVGVNLMVAPFAQEVNQFKDNLGLYSSKLGDFVESAGSWYANTVPSNVKDAIQRVDYTDLATWVTRKVQDTLAFVFSSVQIALELVLIPVLAFYFVLDYRSITREAYGWAAKSKQREFLRIGRRVGQILQSYTFGQLILCLIAGLLTGAFLSILNMPYVVVLALFAGVTRAIPIIGPVVSGVPIVLVGLVYSDSLAVPLYLLIFITVMHFVESKFIMPRLIGDRLSLHPAVVIVVLFIGAEFFGLLGMFLAAPVAAVMRDVLRFYYVRPAQLRDRQKRASADVPPA